MTRRQKRIAVIVCSLIGVAVAAALILTAFQKNLMYFYSPSEVARGEAPRARPFRLGGMVVKGSVSRTRNGLGVRFDVTDFAKQREVYYEGILPDLFREGQGIVAIGQINDAGVFVASEVLAKHDEKYMPPEVADALKKARGTTTAAATP